MFWYALLNGLTFGGLIYISSSGLSLAFGLLRIVNLSHGSLYLLSGYIALSIYKFTNSWWLSLAAASLAGFAASLILYTGLIYRQRFRDNDLAQTLLTLAIALGLAEICLLIWGGRPQALRAPDVFRLPVRIFTIPFSRYRLFMLLVSCFIIVFLWLFLTKTKIGLLIRAGIDDREMVKCLGVNIHKIFLWTFALSGLLAGIAGVIGGTLTMLAPGEDWRILMFTVVAVILGGLGSFWGAVLSSFLTGLLYSFGTFYFAEFALFMLFVPVAVLITVRPYGLFGKEM
ncbi:MAG: branched-chain amino acid ABC transporter permease [Nitrososphaerota archaeon]